MGRNRTTTTVRGQNHLSSESSPYFNEFCKNIFNTCSSTQSHFNIVSGCWNLLVEPPNITQQLEDAMRESPSFPKNVLQKKNSSPEEEFDDAKDNLP